MAVNDDPDPSRRDPSATRAGDVDNSGDRRNAEPPSHHAWRLAILGVIFTLLALVIKTNFALSIDSIIDWAVLVAFIVAATWATDVYYRWWLTKRWPRRTGMATASTVFLLLLLNLHHALCRFGPFGIGYGAIWILVEPLNQMEVRPYRLTVL